MNIGQSLTIGRLSHCRGTTDKRIDFRPLPVYSGSPMVRRQAKRALTAEAFGKCLRWLSENDELAVREYQSISIKMVRYFIHNGCANPKDLFDETIDVGSGTIDTSGDS